MRVSPPGIEWKTSRNPKMGKNWPKNRKWPSARNGEKMVQKWRKNGIWGHFSIFSPFLGRFFPISGRGPFSIFRPISSHFRISARFPFYTRRPDSQGFQRFLRGFSEIFERFSEVLSETLSEADFLSEALSPVAPNRVAP